MAAAYVNVNVNVNNLHYYVICGPSKRAKHISSCLESVKNAQEGPLLRRIWGFTQGTAIMSDSDASLTACLILSRHGMKTRAGTPSQQCRIHAQLQKLSSFTKGPCHTPVFGHHTCTDTGRIDGLGFNTAVLCCSITFCKLPTHLDSCVTIVSV